MLDKIKKAKDKSEINVCIEGGEQLKEMVISPEGTLMIADFELTESTAKGWNIGEFDKDEVWIGIYPYYVFKNVGSDKKPVWESDGGITFGYGYYVNEKAYNQGGKAKEFIDTYVPNASFTPPYIPSNGVPYKVSRSSYMPMDEAIKIYKEKLSEYEDAVNDFLKNNGEIMLEQHQFDALVSFTYQYGKNWWTKDKVMPNFIREGNGVYDSDKVREIFGMHDNPSRRAIEAEVFINGHK